MQTNFKDVKIKQKRLSAVGRSGSGSESVGVVNGRCNYRFIVFIRLSITLSKINYNSALVPINLSFYFFFSLSGFFFFNWNLAIESTNWRYGFHRDRFDFDFYCFLASCFNYLATVSVVFQRKHSSNNNFSDCIRTQ